MDQQQQQQVNEAAEVCRGREGNPTRRWLTAPSRPSSSMPS